MDDEFVETSDVEELEESRATRKRLKISHIYSQLSPEPTTSETEEASDLFTPASLSRFSTPDTLPSTEYESPLSENPNVHSPGLLEGSQDPLLLCDSSEPLAKDNVQCDGDALPPLSNEEDESSHSVARTGRQNTPGELLLDADDLLNFDNFQAPTSPLSSLPPPSPLSTRHSPSSPPSPSPPKLVPRHLPQPSSRPVSPSPQIVESVTIGASRYPMRPRKAHQERPYEYDRRKYKSELRHHPEAIVTLPVERRRHRDPNNCYEEEEEEGSQEQYHYPVESEECEDEAVRSSSPDGDQSKTDPSGSRIPDIPSSDEDEGIDAIRKEVRAQKREAKRALKQEMREKVQQTKKTLKAFPMKTRVGRSRSYDQSLEQGDSSTSSTHPQRISPQPGPSRRPLEYSLPRSADSPVGFRGWDDEDDINRRAHTPLSSSGNILGESQFRGSPGGDDIFAANFSIGGESSDLPAASDSVSTNATGTPIIVDDDSDSGKPEPEEDAESRRKLRYLERMYPKFMWATLEADSTTRTSQHSHRRRADRPPKEDDAQEPVLRPGRARVRKAVGNRPIADHDIKGDSESSDDDIEVPALRPSPSNMASSLFSYHELPTSSHARLSSRASQIIEIPDDDEDENSEEEEEEEQEEEKEEFDNEDIRSFFGNDGPQFTMRHFGLERESMIDYMLSKNVSFNVRKSRKRKARDELSSRSRGASKKPRYKYDIVTAGSGGGHQTLLPFGNHRQSGSKTRTGFVPRSPSKTVSASVLHMQVDQEGTDWDGVADGDILDHAEGEAAKAKQKQKTRKEKVKERKERAKTHGVYILQAENGVQLSSGLRGPAEVTKNQPRSRRRRRKVAAAFQLHDEDKDFSNAIASSSRDISYAKPSVSPGCERARQVVAADPGLAAILQDNRKLEGDNVAVDAYCDASRLNIVVLKPGVTFGKTTFLGRGLLHELLERSCQQHPTIAGPSQVRGFEFGPDMTIPQFEVMLPNICGNIVKFATELPGDDDDNELREWELVIHKTSESLSRLMFTATDACATARLKNIVLEQLKIMVSRMRDAAFSRSSIDLTTLSVCWFAIVLSTKISVSPSDQALQESCEVLIHYLLEYGLDRTISFLQSAGRNLDSSSSLAQRTAELWVCVIHVMHDGFKEHSSARETNIFWVLVQKDIESRFAQKSKLQASEMIWNTIFSLCALSQFSAGGVTFASPRLPAAWAIVELAFKQIRLTTDANIEERLDPRALDKCDRYLTLVISRSFHLVSYCKWSLENASPMLSALAKIFQSRRYGNLRHERADFPEFLRTQNWGSCSEYNRRDSAFVLFLKLIVQAASAAKLLPDMQVNSKVNKLLSFIIPVGALPFSRAKLPTEHELSMLYNRIAAVAVSLHLRPQEQAIRVKQAHEYAKFKDSSFMARLASIRSLNFLTQIVVLEREPLSKEVLTWFGEIADVLMGEFKELGAKHSTVQDENRDSCDQVLFLISMLLGAVRHVMNAHRDSESGVMYPDPALLYSIRKVYNDNNLAQNTKVARELHGVVRSFLAMRAALVPLQKPFIDVDEEESQESQDNWDTFLSDPQVLANLGCAPSGSYQEKDKQASGALKNITWTLFRRLNRYFEQPFGAPNPPNNKASLSNRFMNDVDEWVDSWLECASIVISLRQSFTWDHACFALRDNAWGKIVNIKWRRRLDVKIACKILQLDPTVYHEHREKFICALFQALVPEEITVEHEFLSLLFTIDKLQHPLLRGLHIPSPEPVQSKGPEGRACSRVEYRFNIEQVRTLRLPILRGILGNIAASLGEAEVTKDEALIAENKNYIGWVINNVLSVMSGIRSTLKENSSERRQYEIACKEVVKAVCEEQPRIGALPQMGFWIGWNTSLE